MLVAPAVGNLSSPRTAAAPRFAGRRPAAETFRRAVEADWLLQDRVRTGARVRRGRPTPRNDALGAVDGVKNGKWGFHTAIEDKPWWHVDLGQKEALDRVVLYNRCDACGPRNKRILLLLSDDGRAWKTVYQHDGTNFNGFTDKKPLVIKLDGRPARFVRLALDYKMYFHLDEVEVYPRRAPKNNIALWKPADQSSLSQWSVEHKKAIKPGKPSYPFATVLERGRLTRIHTNRFVHIRDYSKLDAIAARVKALRKDASDEERRRLYFELRWTIRRIALSNPLLSFGELFFTKRAPGSYSHMSDQYYGWWSRPGGGLFILSDYTTDQPKLRSITPKLPTGSYLRPDLSYDATRILFAYCRHYPKMRGMRNKTDKKSIPEDANYHVYEINIDGTGLRRLTRGRYDDFDARYLPDGRIVFLSTRRGQAIQCCTGNAAATLEDPFLPDSYVRCGGGNSRPVAIYTLHVMDRDGRNLRAISAFENFEWTPSLGHDGRILYARWDYVDRHNNAFMSLWATRPDGSMPNLVYGNFTRSPHCIFEARAIPGSNKLLFTASGHHAITAGSICLLDTARGTEGKPPLTRLTPEVCFPETEGWPATYYAPPLPRSERYYLVSWSPRPIRSEGRFNDTNCLGLYLADAFGNLELLYRDPEISSAYPIPLRPRPKPHPLPDMAAKRRTTEGRVLLLDVYRGLDGVPRGSVKRIRIVGCPAKTQPQMNRPSIGITREDPGKLILGSVPVAPDGSAHFRMPAGVAVFFQALDAQGRAVQTMRTLTYVQPGQTLSCVGCHEPRSEAAPNALASAASRESSRLTPGPEGTWPRRYDRLVQPVLDRHCVRCHSPKGKAEACKKLNLTAAKSYQALMSYGRPSLHDHVRRHYLAGRSHIGAGGSLTSPILAHLRKGHQEVKLAAEDFERLITWIDTYAQSQGHFSPEQERRLVELRQRSANLLTERRGHKP
jgi:hypothetical protein